MDELVQNAVALLSVDTGSVVQFACPDTGDLVTVTRIRDGTVSILRWDNTPASTLMVKGGPKRVKPRVKSC
jgi:hypothetical protein